MNKNAIKKFAIDARKKLIESVTDKAGMLGITPDNCSEAISKGTDFEVYKTAAGTEVTLNRKQCQQRKKLVDQIHSRGFEAVIEEVAYTWFNRICAIRFMEVNDYMYPVRVRVLSSEKEGKNEPDVVTMAPDIDWNFTDKEKEYIIEAKMNNQLDDLFKMLFIKQCNLLHEVLPGLFEETEDYTEMLLNISFTNEDDVVRMLIDEEKGIPEEYFNVNTLDENGNPTGQVEIIGWLYQYYNTELKDDTFAKLKRNIKISKERIPAATQLFTPDWIVRYMVENSVGRIWIEHMRAVDPSVDEKETAEKFGWKYYLPEAEQEESVNVKLAEIRATYKDLKPEDITCIDPCMGSGHILVAMFDVLMDIYESAGYDKRDATFQIVEHNIHGLDIDKRAYQLAYFAVMMKGRGYNRRFLNNRDGATPEPKVYAFEESNEINRGHLKYFGFSMNTKDREKAEQQVRYLLDTFVDAREYGSILNVEECDWELIQCFINDLQVGGQFTLDSVGSDETQNQLEKLVKVAENMGKKYDAVVTNPPYMSSSNGSSKILAYIKDHYPNSKADLYSVFIEKCGKMIKRNGFQAMITQHSWMFLSSFEKLRDDIENKTIINMAHLGARGFDEIGGEVVQTTSFVMENTYLTQYKGVYIRLLEGKSEREKENLFLSGKKINKACSLSFECIPGHPIAYWVNEKLIAAFKGKHLSDYGKTRQGFATGDNDRFLRYWTEIDFSNIGFDFNSVDEFISSGYLYAPCNKGGEARKWYGNNYMVCKFDKKSYDILSSQGNHLPSRDYYFREGLTWSALGTGFLSMRYAEPGFVFETKGSRFFANDNNDLYYLLAVMNSKVTMEAIKILCPTIDFHEGPVSNVPILIYEKERISQLAKKNVAIAKKDWDDKEFSWNYSLHPLLRIYRENSEDLSIKDCYRIWEQETEDRFEQTRENEKVINTLLINAYGMQEDIDSEVQYDEITISKANEKNDIQSLISYAVGCMFGRYSLDQDGLQCTSPIIDESKYCLFKPVTDDIIPITDDEYLDNDIIVLFVNWLETAFGKKRLNENMDYIASSLGIKGKNSREIIRKYFLNDFFVNHCNDYSITGGGKRPIYWLFESGKENGFKCLIYIHRYNKDIVGIIRTDYLHKVQKAVEHAKLRAERTIEVSNNNTEKATEKRRIEKYVKQLSEIKLYDEAIAYVAGKRLDIDLNQGIKSNYQLFQGVEVSHEGKRCVKVDLLRKL